MKTLNKYQRIPLDFQAFRNVRTVLQRRGIFFYAGNSSLTVPSRGEKYLMATNHKGIHICREWEDEQGCKVLMSPGEAARTELRRHFPTTKRVGWMPSHVSLFDWRWPILCVSPSLFHNASYIDLKGAYHQIYSRLWLDVAFPCGYGSLDLAPIASVLEQWKGARNSLIGVTASRSTIAVKGYKRYTISTTNPYLSPHLWATIQAILNEVAFEARSCGAIYIATDGYIFPKASLADRFTEKLYDWGLKWRRVDGDAHIKHWGSWRVGKKGTQTYWKSDFEAITNFDTIKVLDTDYPSRLVRWWAHSIPRYRQRGGY